MNDLTFTIVMWQILLRKTKAVMPHLLVSGLKMILRTKEQEVINEDGHSLVDAIHAGHVDLSLRVKIYIFSP